MPCNIILGHLPFMIRLFSQIPDGNKMRLRATKMGMQGELRHELKRLKH